MEIKLLKKIKSPKQYISILCEKHYNKWTTYWNSNNIFSKKELADYYYNDYILGKNNIYLLFDNQIFIGSISVVENEFSNYIKKDSNSVFITDFFIFEKYRKQGYGTYLIKKIINILGNKVKYLSVIDYNLIKFYNNLDFYHYDTHILGNEKYLIFKFSR